MTEFKLITYLETINIKYYYLSLFIFTTTFLFFHLHDLPVQFYTLDDLIFVESAIENSYGDFFKYLFIQRDTSLVHTCQYTSCVYLRPGMSLIWKILYDLFGFNINIFHFFRVLCVTGISFFIFYFLELSTKKKIIALLGGIFYATLPPIFSATWFWGESELFAELFLVVAIFFVYKITIVKNQSTYTSNFYKKTVFLILFTIFLILSFRTRETTKINVIIIIILILLFYRSLLWLITMPTLIIFYYIIPYDTGNYLSPFTLTAIYNRVIASSGADYAPEILTIFSISQHFKQVPIAMLSQLGFFLGYFVLLSVTYLLFTKAKPNTIKNVVLKIKNEATKPEEFMLYLSIIWLSISIFAFGFFSTAVEHRYFVVGLIPFTFIIFIVIDKVANSINTIKYKKLYLASFFIFISLVVVINAFHITYHIRGGTIGHHKGNYEAVKYLLSQENNQQYKNEEISFIFFYWYFNKNKYSEKVAVDTINRTFIKGKSYLGLRTLEEFNESFVGENIIYFVNQHSNTTPIMFDETIYEVKYVGAFGGCFDESLYCLFKNIFITPKKTHFSYSIKRR